MSASLSTEGRGLTAFRLSEVPLDLRLRAARYLATRADAALATDAGGVKGLLARLSSDVSMGDPEVIRRVAEHPSDRVYWITRRAWEKVMGDADAA